MTNFILLGLLLLAFSLIVWDFIEGYEA